MTLLNNLFDKATDEEGALASARLAVSGVLDWVAGTPEELEAHYDALTTEKDDYIIDEDGFMEYQIGQVGTYSIEVIACVLSLYRNLKIPAAILGADLGVRYVGSLVSIMRNPKAKMKKDFGNTAGIVGYARMLKDKICLNDKDHD